MDTASGIFNVLSNKYLNKGKNANTEEVHHTSSVTFDFIVSFDSIFANDFIYDDSKKMCLRIIDDLTPILQEYLDHDKINPDFQKIFIIKNKYVNLDSICFDFESREYDSMEKYIKDYNAYKQEDIEILEVFNFENINSNECLSIINFLNIFINRGGYKQVNVENMREICFDILGLFQKLKNIMGITDDIQNNKNENKLENKEINEIMEKDNNAFKIKKTIEIIRKKTGKNEEEICKDIYEQLKNKYGIDLKKDNKDDNIKKIIEHNSNLKELHTAIKMIKIKYKIF